MKKFVLSALVFSLSFILFSFTPVSKSSGEYDIVNGNTKFVAGSAGSFVEYWSHGTEKDVTWKDYVRTWTNATEEAQIAAISGELDQLGGKN